jgi:hypothetical protein
MNENYKITPQPIKKNPSSEYKKGYDAGYKRGIYYLEKDISTLNDEHNIILGKKQTIIDDLTRRAKANTELYDIHIKKCYIAIGLLAIGLITTSLI